MTPDFSVRWFSQKNLSLLASCIQPGSLFRQVGSSTNPGLDLEVRTVGSRGSPVLLAVWGRRPHKHNGVLFSGMFTPRLPFLSLSFCICKNRVSLRSKWEAKVKVLGGALLCSCEHSPQRGCGVRGCGRVPSSVAGACKGRMG